MTFAEKGAAFKAPLSFTVAKVAGQANEDAFAPSRRKGVVALSDGASISFDSAAWSRILTRQYAQNPIFERAWLRSAIATFNENYDRDQLPWMQQAAFDKGSFASLLGVQVDAQRLVKFFAIGDTIALICDRDDIAFTFPYEHSEQFSSNPQLLSTNPAENDFLNHVDDGFDEFSVIRHLDAYQQPSVLCMTDALGHWVLKRKEEGESPIPILRQLTTRSRFERFVDGERKAGRMRRDDTTMLALWDLV